MIPHNGYVSEFDALDEDEFAAACIASGRWVALEVEAEKQFQLDRQQWILAPVATEEGGT